MEQEELLKSAIQIKEHCKNTDCEDCIFCKDDTCDLKAYCPAGWLEKINLEE